MATIAPGLPGPPDDAHPGREPNPGPLPSLSHPDLRETLRRAKLQCGALLRFLQFAEIIRTYHPSSSIPHEAIAELRKNAWPHPWRSSLQQAIEAIEIANADHLAPIVCGSAQFVTATEASIDGPFTLLGQLTNATERDFIFEVKDDARLPLSDAVKGILDSWSAASAEWESRVRIEHAKAAKYLRGADRVESAKAPSVDGPVGKVPRFVYDDVTYEMPNGLPARLIEFLWNRPHRSASQYELKDVWLGDVPEWSAIDDVKKRCNTEFFTPNRIPYSVSKVRNRDILQLREER